MDSSLWVVVPFYNEAKGIEPTIHALAAQSDRRFSLLFVDNASTDNTAKTVTAVCKAAKLEYQIIHEPQKGTGAAADTGFRYAIKHGATHIARTDADCLPATNWVKTVKAGFDEGLQFMGGRLKLRTDDIKPRPLDQLVVPSMIAIGVWYGKLFYHNRQFQYPFFMAAGGNMAITAELYLQAGGFPRSSIADTNEDEQLAEKVRKLTKQAKYRRGMAVYASIRRVRKYGYLNTLRWFSGRNYQGQVDVR